LCYRDWLPVSFDDVLGTPLVLSSQHPSCESLKLGGISFDGRLVFSFRTVSPSFSSQEDKGIFRISLYVNLVFFVARPGNPHSFLSPRLCRVRVLFSVLQPPRPEIGLFPKLVLLFQPSRRVPLLMTPFIQTSQFRQFLASRRRLRSSCTCFPSASALSPRRPSARFLTPLSKDPLLPAGCTELSDILHAGRFFHSRRSSRSLSTVEPFFLSTDFFPFARKTAPLSY